MKKTLSLLLALGMLLTGITALAEVTPFEETLTITILAPFYSQEQPPVDGNPALEALEKMYNVDLKVEYTPQGDFAQKFNTIMASREIPMVISVSSGVVGSVAFTKYARSGAFWDLTDYIQNNETMRTVLTSPNSLTATATAGRNYLIPAVVEESRVALIYRKDWADKLGIAPPATVAEVYEMAKRFTLEDPDGNGKADTYGYAYIDDADKELTYAGFDTLAVASGVANRWGEMDGKLVPYFMTPGYMDVLKLYKDMYDSGYMNKDFALIKGNAKYEPILTSQAGFMFTSAMNAAYPNGKFDTLIDSTPGAQMAYTMLFTAPEGNKVTNSVIAPGGVGGIVLTKEGAKDEATVQRIMDFFAAIYANKESAMITAIGIEGLHYAVEDGKITVSDEQAKLRSTDGTYELFVNTFPRRVLADDYGQPINATEAIKRDCVAQTEYAVLNGSVGLMDEESVVAQNNLATMISDARVQFIMGMIDEAGFKAVVDEWLAQGGQAIVDSVNANAQTVAK